jgi:putrescine transport system ATP-binding protein
VSDDVRELVRIEGISKRFGSVQALDDVSLTIAENEFFALLGPSGCGKTTLLRMLAGFESPDSGRILLEGEDMVGVPPYRRPFNMMFQSYALFPHMSVFDNVAYGLRQERVPRAQLAERTQAALEMVQLGGLGRRRPGQLSGGQRQRVALARALVKRPRLLLLDEPLAALDRKLRGQMQYELKNLQAAVGITFVIVTHDQEEALVMADRAAILDHGRVLQVGPPTELYERPTSRFVATFVGDSNLFEGTLRLDGEEPCLETPQRAYPVSSEAVRRATLADGDPAALVVRPERVRFDGDGEEGRIVEVDYLGALRRYVVRLADGKDIIARVQSGSPHDAMVVGQTVTVGWATDDAAVVRLPSTGPEVPTGGPAGPASDAHVHDP